MLMFDFFHHNIEMACALLDNCGRFLYRSQDSHHRTKIYLVRIKKYKTASYKICLQIILWIYLLLTDILKVFEMNIVQIKYNSESMMFKY